MFRMQGSTLPSGTYFNTEGELRQGLSDAASTLFTPYIRQGSRCSRVARHEADQHRTLNGIATLSEIFDEGNGRQIEDKSGHNRAFC